jgi:hypothetical protein
MKMAYVVVSQGYYDYSTAVAGGITTGHPDASAVSTKNTSCPQY